MIKEACDKFRNQLENWFSGKKERFSSFEINNEWISFKENNPEYSLVFDDIYFDYIIKEGSYAPGCMNGCCVPFDSFIVQGVLVEPIDYNRWNELVNYKSVNGPSKDFRKRLEYFYPLE
jgi:hypothetical protein